MVSQRKDDLDKVTDVLIAFFRTKRAEQSLALLTQFGVSGWEKWWQTELAIFLAQSDQTIAEWDMEHPFDSDLRTRLTQTRMSLDIGFRLKRHAKDQWYFVELKQADDYRRCIDRMCKDADKVFSARRESFEGLSVRYSACAGVFRTAEEETILDYAEGALDRVDIEHDGFFIEEVGKGYTLLVF